MRDRQNSAVGEAIVIRSLELGASPDPLWLLSQPAARRGPRWFWEAPADLDSESERLEDRPDSRRSSAGVVDGTCRMAASGAAHWLNASGPDRFERLQAGLDACRLLGDAQAARWLGGFGFWEHAGSGPWAGFPGALFVLPELNMIQEFGRLRLVLAAPESRAAGLPAMAEEWRERIQRAAEDEAGIRGSDSLGTDALSSRSAPQSVTAFGSGPRPSPSAAIAARLEAEIPAIRARVAPAVAAIRAGRADKVVLATALEHGCPVPIDPLTLLARQRARQPQCYCFLMAPTPEAAFVGATPERLLRLRGRRLETMALAGSVRRSADAAEDAALAAGLLASAKDRREHALVVEAIHASLGSMGAEIEGSTSEPRIRRLAGIQHLETPIAARLPSRERLLEVARRLHPTPALGGSPREAALGLIAELEAPAPGRGWYAGGIGWFDRRGDGELAVAIRSLLLRGRMVLGMAGAGLVADSDPEAEAREIALKLGLALAALDD